jgi:hypothetical protein
MAIGVLVDQTGSGLFHTGPQMSTDVTRKQQGHSGNRRGVRYAGGLDTNGS